MDHDHTGQEVRAPWTIAATFSVVRCLCTDVATLIGGAVASEPSLDAFVVSASPRLVRAAWLLVGDRQLAEDHAQETLARLYPRWRDMREPEAAGANAHRTIVRLSRRKQQRTALAEYLAGDRS